ncbi:MAG: universal stress protein [Steroidobacterales bacterium]
MSNIQAILAVVDPSTVAQPGVAKAARLARAFGARLELFICDNSPALAADRYYAAEFCDAARDGIRAGHFGQLATLAAPIRRQGVNVDTDVVFCDSLYAGIVGKVRDMRADLVVKDTHYHGAIRRALFTNTDWHLIRECPAALLLATPVTWRSLVRFAAAIDPGHTHDKPAVLDHELLMLTERLAIGMRGDARAVHVVPAHANAGGPRERLARQAELEAVTSQHPNFFGSVDLIDGVPVEALPNYVIASAIDVLVMGAVARSAVLGLLVGRTAEKVLDRTPCDILVWKPSQLTAQLLAATRAA